MINTFVQLKVRRYVRLKRRAVYAIASVVMGLMGTLFSTAALASGVYNLDLLAMLFVIGAAGSLCLLLVWYLSKIPAPVKDE